MTLEVMNQRFRIIEDMWKVGSDLEQAEYLVELAQMQSELDQISGAQADGALWLKRTVDRLARNITAAQASG